MRSLVLAAAAIAFLALPAHADTMKNCGAAWSAMSAADKAKTTYSAYSKTCLAKGSTATVASPAPAGATGKCKDGTYTMSKTHSGACSHHGGVDSWL
jgi:hypothetical protein